ASLFRRPFRVQVFRHAEQAGDYEWPGYATIQPSHLEGPAVDELGQPTPVLRLYWRGAHFVPGFPVVPGALAGGPGAAGRAGVAAAGRARRDFRVALAEIGRLAAVLADPQARAEVRREAADAAGPGNALAGSL